MCTHPVVDELVLFCPYTWAGRSCMFIVLFVRSSPWDVDLVLGNVEVVCSEILIGLRRGEIEECKHMCSHEKMRMRTEQRCSAAVYPSKVEKERLGRTKVPRGSRERISGL